MLNIEKNLRDELVNIIQKQIVPVPAGHTLMQVAQALVNLKEVIVPEEKNKEPEQKNV